MTASKEYEHISFTFNKSSGFLDDTSFDVTAYLLVPDDVMPELRQWEQVAAQPKNDIPRDHPSGQSMFKTLKDKGALLHRTNGPAYEEVEKIHSNPNHSKVVVSQFWEKGILQRPVPDSDPASGQTIKSLGKYIM